MLNHKIYIYTHGMGHTKVPIFQNALPCNGNFAFRVVSVPFYNFPCFYCCQHFKSTAQRTVKERLKNGKKNGAKNGMKTVQKNPVRKIITVQTLKKTVQ